MTIESAKVATSTTLNQVSWTQVNGMTITPGAGNFLAVFTMECEYSSSSGSETLEIAIFVNGVEQSHTIRTIQQNSSLSNMNIGIGTTCYVQPGAGQVVEVRYRASSASNPMTGWGRELNTFPAVGQNYQDTDTVSDTVASATWETLPNMTRTPAAGNYLIVFSCETDPATGNVAGFRVSVGGSPIPHTERRSHVESSANPTRYVVMIAASISPNGSQVVEIEWNRASGSGTCTCYERNMILIGTAAADIKQAIGTVTDTNNNTTPVQIDDMIIVDPGANDWLVIFNSYWFSASLSAPGTWFDLVIREGGVVVTDTNREFMLEDSLDSTWQACFAAGKVTVAPATDDIQQYWTGSDSTYTRSMYTRTMIAIREISATYKLEGITKDKDGVALGSCKCFLVKDNGDDTYQFIAYQLSNAVTGAYSFIGILDNDPNYQVIAWKDDTPHVFDVTDHDLTPEVE